jgi:hypothetical protein
LFLSFPHRWASFYSLARTKSWTIETGVGMNKTEEKQKRRTYIEQGCSLPHHSRLFVTHFDKQLKEKLYIQSWFSPLLPFLVSRM